MAEPMPALAPPSAQRPAARKRLPHPHPAPPRQKVEPEPDSESTLPGRARVPRAESWTPAAVPMARPAGRPRRRSSRQTPAERLLRYSLRFGFFVNGAALLIPRIFPTAGFQSWRYSGDDFLLAAAVLLSGQILLMLGRNGDLRQDD
ncbi:MAG TPA: hypothetical protein VF179_18300 [Thermoanaerobaculia bacterium]|nr:hypothetical protein [Thermoanaerobaculia bacterium]